MRDRRRHVWSAIHICNVLMLASVTGSPLYIPQFLSGAGSGRNIRHLPCVSTRTGETGVCMFAFTCAKANGTHLGTCIDRFYFGSCCKIEQEPDDVFPQENTIEDGPLHPPKPLFTSTLSSIESNEIPPYFTKPKPILEKKPSFSGPTTQRIETTTSRIVETIATKPQKVTSKRPIIYTTTESVGLSTFQTVQGASTNGIQSRPTLDTSQVTTPSTAKPFNSGKPSISTIVTTIPPRRPSLPSSFPTQSSGSSYPATFGSSTTFSSPSNFGSSISGSTTSAFPSTSGSTSTSGFPSTSSSASTSGSISTSGSTITSGSISTSGSTSTSGSPSISGSPSTSTSASLPSSTPASTFTLPQRPTIIDITNPPLTKNITQISEVTTTASTKPVDTTTRFPLLTSTSRVPATRFPPRNSTSKPLRPISSTTTKRPSSTLITNKPTITSTSDIKKPISSTIRPSLSSRPSQTNATKPSSAKPAKPSKPTKPYSSSTKVPPTTGRPTVTETIPFGGFKPTKAPTRISTPKPATTTSKTKIPTKPTKTSSAKPSPSKPSSSKPSSSKPSSSKPSSVKPSSGKPSSAKPSPTGTTTTTTTTTSTTRSTTKPTTEKTEPSSATQSEVASTTPSITFTTKEIPKTPIPTTSTESNIYIPLNGSTQTNQVVPPKKPENESAQTTYAPGLVTWTSSVDETTTSKIAEASSTTEEPVETEWAPITTPDGWVIIHSPTTEQEEAVPPSTPKPSVATTSVPFFPTKPITEIPTAGTFITTRPVIPTTLSSIATVTVSTESPQTIIPAINMSDYKQVCGRRLFPEGRIVGGNSSSFGRWPWQISLRQWRTSTYLHKCGAALLNENWAITAAHCVENVPPSDLLLRIGEHDLANESEPYGYQERRVQLVASHPQFDPRTFEYDLALLRFYEPIQPFQPNILPICLPDDDENYVGHTAYVTGWGRLYEDGPLPSVLQEVPVPVINNTVCESMYRTAGFIENIPHIFICAGWRKGGFDSCEGDSGGPMVIQRPRDKRWILAGVISWGIGCAEPNQPGVYTRISQFRDWINQILQF